MFPREDLIEELKKIKDEMTADRLANRNDLTHARLFTLIEALLKYNTLGTDK
jgi:hypothetical protein